MALREKMREHAARDPLRSFYGRWQRLLESPKAVMREFIANQTLMPRDAGTLKNQEREFWKAANKVDIIRYTAPFSYQC